MKKQNREQVDLARSLLSAAAAGALMLCIPAQAQDCGDLELTQSLSFEIMDGAGIACGPGGINAENSFARCYLPSAESFNVRCVDLAIEINTGSDLPAALNIYIDIDGCPPTHPDLDLVLLASEPFIIPAGTFLELFEIELSAPVMIKAGASLVVELDYPPHTDGAVLPGMNNAGETGPTYIRSESCGLPDYVAICSLLFPRCDWVQVVRGEVPCPTDINNDGVTNVLDLIDLLLCFGLPATPPCDTGQDVNGDGTVNVLDLIELLLAFGTACP